MKRIALAPTLLCACFVPDTLGAGASSTTSTSSSSSTTSASTHGESSSSSSTGWADDAGAYEVDGGAESCVFSCPPDVGTGSGNVSVECDIWAQDCPAGEKCMPWANDGGSSWNATRCSPLDPHPASVGDPCKVEGSSVSGIDDCDISQMCWEVDLETNVGTCVAFCMGWEANAFCEDPTTTCAITNEGVLILCLPPCDPLLQDCLGDQGCYPVDDDFVCAPDASGDAGAFGDPCEFINVCDAGLFCANAAAVPECLGSVGCCSTFCDLAAADPDANCPGIVGGQSCLPWFERNQAPPGREDLGACGIPQ